MARVAEHRDSARLSEPVRAMLAVLFAQGRIDLDPDTLTGGPGDATRLEEFVAGHPETDALLRNTFAVTTLSAGFKPNVIPARAQGTVDCRILPGEDPEGVAAQVGEMVRDLSIRVEIAFAERPNGSPRGPLFDALSDAILSVHPDAVVLPYMSTGFTDSRFFRSIGVDTYGLMPILLPREEFGRIHGVDERIPNRSSIRLLAASAILPYRAGSERSAAENSATAVGSSNEISAPVFPGTTSSRTPSTSAATTGSPAAIASATASPNPSLRLGCQSRSDSSRIPATPDRFPAKATDPPLCNPAQSLSSMGRRGPSPANTSRAPGIAPAKTSNARTASSGRFTGESDPTTAIPGRSEEVRVTNRKRSGSTPFSTQRSLDFGQPKNRAESSICGAETTIPLRPSRRKVHLARARRRRRTNPSPENGPQCQWIT
jgi:hypothetical protein